MLFHVLQRLDWNLFARFVVYRCLLYSQLDSIPFLDLLEFVDVLIEVKQGTLVLYLFLFLLLVKFSYSLFFHRGFGITLLLKLVGLLYFILVRLRILFPLYIVEALESVLWVEEAPGTFACFQPFLDHIQMSHRLSSAQVLHVLTASGHREDVTAWVARPQQRITR